MPLGWIDFSKTERSKVLSVLDMLSENGVLDELGIAPIRDGFANVFFPGTSTIQTRAKYFFIVPYALKDLELSGETNPARIQISLDAKERACGEAFVSQEPDGIGIIGKRSLASGKWVKRTPADIYWSGLRQYGIFTGGNLSLSEYIRGMCALKNQKSALKKLGNRNDEADESERDDDRAGDVRSFQFWRMPLYRKDWYENLEMALTPEEAAFLKEQILLTCPDSMLAYFLKNNKLEVLNLKSFADIEALIADCPEDMQRDYQMALQFSDFIYAVRTVYNVIISDGLNETANTELQRLLPEFGSLADIDVGAIFKRLSIYNNPPLRVFLTNAQAAMKIGDVVALQEHIKNREIALKGQSRAKTCHPGQYGDEWLGGGALDYRFGNARTIIRDIFESEVAGVAESE